MQCSRVYVRTRTCTCFNKINAFARARTNPRILGRGALTRGKIACHSEQDGSSAAVNVGIPFDSGGVYLLDSRGYVAKKLYILCADAVSLSDFAPGHVMTTYTMCY